jgi:uncharacterized protein YndB with AHSA1/START domain
MSSDTFEPGAERSVIRLERRYPHPPARVWRAVTTPEHLAAWFPSKVTVDLRVDGRLTFTDDPNTADTKGRVTDLDPPRLFAFTWEDDHLRFELEPDGDGTVLRLVHTFGDTYGAASFASGWDSCLADLGAALDGREPEHRRPGAEDHERYLRRFGLDDGTVEPAGAAWQVRFERQLTTPEDEVRAAIAGWPDGVDWELRPGTGHGPRLVVTRPAATRADADAEHAAWKARLAELR